MSTINWEEFEKRAEQKLASQEEQSAKHVARIERKLQQKVQREEQLKARYRADEKEFAMRLRKLIPFDGIVTDKEGFLRKVVMYVKEFEMCTASYSDTGLFNVDKAPLPVETGVITMCGCRLQLLESIHRDYHIKKYGSIDYVSTLIYDNYRSTLPTTLEVKCESDELRKVLLKIGQALGTLPPYKWNKFDDWYEDEARVKERMKKEAVEWLTISIALVAGAWLIVAWLTSG